MDTISWQKPKHAWNAEDGVPMAKTMDLAKFAGRSDLFLAGGSACLFLFLEAMEKYWPWPSAASNIGYLVGFYTIFIFLLRGYAREIVSLKEKVRVLESQIQSKTGNT